MTDQLHIPCWRCHDSIGSGCPECYAAEIDLRLPHCGKHLMICADVHGSAIRLEDYDER